MAPLIKLHVVKAYTKKYWLIGLLFNVNRPVPSYALYLLQEQGNWQIISIYVKHWRIFGGGRK